MLRHRFALIILILPVLSGLSMAQEPWIFSAMSDEMARTTSSLKIDTLPPAYYVAYTVTENEQYTIRASMGSLLSSTHTPRSRSINVQMRVGNFSFDNTNFVSFSFGRSGVTSISPDGTKSTTYEDDYSALRRDLWLASDAVYKEALADLSKKKSALQNKVRSDTTADFSATKPFSTSVAPISEKFDRARWEEITRRLSGVPKKFQDVQSSEINTGFARDYYYFLDSEGSQHTRHKSRAWVEVKASTQAPDGMPLSNFIAFYGNSVADLPTEKEMIAGIERMTGELVALRNASVLDSYSGPIIFENQAGAELLSQALGPNLSNFREPMVDNPQLEQMMKSQHGDLPFQNKIGARVLPEFLSVKDVPTKTMHNGVSLIAAQSVDYEGVQSSDVSLVEKGVLRALLMGRNPHKRISESNGHAYGFPPSAFFTNLFITASTTKSDAELRAQLISVCKDRDLPFGIIIRRINNPYFKRLFRDDADIFSFTRGGPPPLVLEPILVYKIFADGKEELVRGVEISGMTVSSFKEILAVSNKEFVYNHITGLKSPSLTALFNPPQIRVSVTTPSLLFESVDLKRATRPFRTPPVASHPVFGK